MNYARQLVATTYLLLLICIYGAAQTASLAADVARRIPAVAGLPVLFEDNDGQEDTAFRYLARQGALRLRFAHDSVNIAVRGTAKPQDELILKFIGASRESQLHAPEKPAAEVNYILGPNSKDWHTHISTFRRVEYKDLYPGVDLAFYGNGRNVEHDFVLAPGIDPAEIELEVKGARRLSMAPSGDLVATMAEVDIRLKKPVAYQMTATGKRLVEVGYRLTGSQIHFATNAYDRRLPLVIDPVLTYSTWLAGSSLDMVSALAADSSGNVYVAGFTNSVDFPVRGGYSCVACKQSMDLFVTKLDPTGSNVVYSTYIGGSGTDQPFGIAVDGNGNALVGGATGSSDFPLINSYTTYSGATTTYGFVLSLSADGSQLNYSSLLGQVDLAGSWPAYPMALTVDGGGNAYLVGKTFDVDFPITSGTVGSTVQPYPYSNLFLSKLDTLGNISYSTTVPGTLPYTDYTVNLNDFNPYTVGVDASGNTYIGGKAGPGLPTTAGTISPTFPGDPNNPTSYGGFLLKLNFSASGISFGTYLPYTDFARAIALHSSGVYVAGVTSSTQFPATAGVFQASIPPGQNCTCNAGYIANLKLDATGYNYATFLTGTPASSNVGTNIMSLSLDSIGDIWVAGTTGSADFPLQLPMSPNFPLGGNVSGFVTSMKPDLSKLTFSSFLSGWSGLYHTTQLFVNAGPNGTAFVAGNTDDPDFFTTAGVFESSLPSAMWPFNVDHAIVAKINTDVPNAAPLYVPLALNFSSFPPVGSTVIQSVTVTNVGNADLQFVGASFSSPEYSQANTCASLVAPGSSCRIDVAFSPDSVGQETKTMTVITNGALANQTIFLYGSAGPGFVLGTTGNASATQTVRSGQTATYAMSLNSAQFAANISLTCSGAPQYATCSVNPGSVALTTNGQVPVTVSVSTSQVASLVARKPTYTVYSALLLALVVVPIGLPRRRRQSRLGCRAQGLFMLLSLAVVLAGSACGGGSGGGGSGTTTRTVAPGTYKLQLSAAGGGVSTHKDLTLIVQ